MLFNMVNDQEIECSEEEEAAIKADWEQQSMLNAEKAKRIQAEDYLKSTDWYIHRYVDNGMPIPVNVKEKRQEARQVLSKN